MGYFSNGSEGDDYRAKYCDKCVHDIADGCEIWNAHLLLNYEAHSDPKHILHVLIPRSKDKLDNERCRMFLDKGLLSNLALQKLASEAA